MTENCTKCGKTNDSEHYFGLRNKAMCFSCNFWTETKERNPLIVNGNSYLDGGNQVGVSRSLLGFAGRVFRYRRLGETEWKETNNMWHKGTVPEVFREEMPDNAEFENVTKHNVGGITCFDVR